MLPDPQPYPFWKTKADLINTIDTTIAYMRSVLGMEINADIRIELWFIAPNGTPYIGSTSPLNEFLVDPDAEFKKITDTNTTGTLYTLRINTNRHEACGHGIKAEVFVDFFPGGGDILKNLKVNTIFYIGNVPTAPAEPVTLRLVTEYEIDPQGKLSEKIERLYILRSAWKQDDGNDAKASGQGENTWVEIPSSSFAYQDYMYLLRQAIEICREDSEVHKLPPEV